MKIPKVRMTVEIRFRHDGYELVRDVARVAVVPTNKGVCYGVASTKLAVK